MSLLMDALKKAEKEKQKAGEETTALDSTQTGEHTDEQVDAFLQTQPPFDPADETAGLSLEPLDDGLSATSATRTSEQTDLTSTTPDASASGERDDDSNLLDGFEADGKDSSTATGTITGTNTAEGFDKDATLPSERTIKASVDEYFDASLSMQRTTDTGTVRGDIDTGLAEGTQVGAQTVFAAGKGNSPYGAATWVAVISLVLLVSLGVAYVYYYLQTPTPMAVPSPTVARTIDSAGQKAPIELPELPARETGTVAAAGSVATDTAASDDNFTVVEHPDGPGLPAGDAATLTGSTVAAPEAAATSVADAAGPQSTDAAAVTDSSEMTEPVSEEIVAVIDDEPTGVVAGARRALGQVGQALTGEQEVVPALMSADERAAMMPARLKITRTTQPPKVSADIQQAYTAYTAGNYQQAGELYKSVLERDSGQRDALLGLAAIAQHYGDRASAARYYRQVLKLNPQDQVAAAGLFHLNGGNATAPVSESQLKLLLDQNPASAPIHFSLGSLYARTSRWPDAQQAFFEAWRADRDNPDYAYNLAVSLDQLHQHRAAIDYYRKALAGADGRPIKFNPAQVLARIQALGGQ